MSRFWVSYDIVWTDKSVDVREPKRWTESTVNGWRRHFTDPSSESWYVFIDKPDLLVMRAGDSVSYVRVSINVPEKEE